MGLGTGSLSHQPPESSELRDLSLDSGTALVSHGEHMWVSSHCPPDCPCHT